LPKGAYFYKLKMNASEVTRKLVLVK
jgi:hypothetical protein